ncbi:putative uncharacterized protein encoded by MAPKAPK5-AS1 [Molothrus aeneus]|uniref:putative uncharacterized protein encoded by MAPKAPK5-AS1 n=1 Tax=Molothrus aeneus TaxID=84833 RepID=UPI00345B095E
MPGCSREVLGRNPAVSAALRGRAARGGGRRLPALPGALPQGEPAPFPPPGSGGRRPGAGSPSGGGARRGRDAAAALPFPSLPAPQPRGSAGAATGSVPGAQGSRCRRPALGGGDPRESARARRMRRWARRAGEAQRSGRSRGSPRRSP